MTLTIELPEEIFSRLRIEDVKENTATATAVRVMLDYVFPIPTASELLKLPKEARRGYLEKATLKAQTFYDADMALPESERELTCIQSASGQDFIEQGKPAV